MKARIAQERDRAVLAKVLKRSFVDDPVLRWILPAKQDYERIAESFFSHILKQTFVSGSCYTTDGQYGVSIWEKPNFSPTLTSQLLSFARLTWLFRGNISRALNLQSLMESYRPRKPFWHLTYIATDPVHQGRGIGSTLLKPITNISNDDGLPIYLECSNRENLSFYRAHNFRLIDEITYPGGPTIWPMLREEKHAY